MKALFLGSGTSVGVPVIGCGCEVCRSTDPHNRRLRSSVLITTDSTSLLIDFGPDLRAQALRHNITAVDAVLCTHEHLDHVAGFDDLRAFCWTREELLPIYAGGQCVERLKTMYPWAFEPGGYRGYVRAHGICHHGREFRVGDIMVQPVPVMHSSVETYGYALRAGSSSFGYVPDVKEMPPASRELLSGLDALALDGLCFPQHRTHLCIDENIALMHELAPKRGIVTHIGHRVEHHALEDYLPDFMQPAFDGLELEL